MKTERRHELQSNQLAEFLTDAGEKAKPYAKGLLGVALAALVIVCAYLYLSRRAAAEEGASWDSAWQAISSRNEDDLRTVISKYPNKPAAIWSQLVLADIELGRGVAGLFAQKSAGRDLIRSAYEDYQHVAEHATHPLLREQAQFGMGRAQESLNQLDKAREAYEKVVKDFPSGPYAKRAQQRADELARDSTKVFYDWFAAAEPATSSSGKGGPFSNPFDESGSSDKSFPPLPPGLVLPDGDKSKAPPPEPKPDQSKAKTDEAKPGSNKAEPSKPDAGKTSDAKTGDAKPVDAKPDEIKSPDEKPAATKSGDVKPPETKPVDGKKGDSKSSDAKSGDAKAPASNSEPPKSAAPSPAPEKSGSAK
jgi:hypothetical protein